MVFYENFNPGQFAGWRFIQATSGALNLSDTSV